MGRWKRQDVDVACLRDAHPRMYRRTDNSYGGWQVFIKHRIWQAFNPYRANAVNSSLQKSSVGTEYFV